VPCARHDRRAAEQCRDRPTIERRGHDEDSEVVAQDGPRLQRQRESDIGVEIPLVELIEDHEADAVERRIVLQHPSEHAFGHDLDARPRPDARVEPNAVAHGLSDALAEQSGHVGGSRTCCETPRLEHHDLRAAQPRLIEEGEGNASRLSGARRRLEHGHASGCERRVKRGKDRCDGEIGRDASSHPGWFRMWSAS
jgi:hypothetical protein